jgi:hypothetical protein
MTKMPGDYSRLAGSELKPAPDARRLPPAGTSARASPARCLPGKLT